MKGTAFLAHGSYQSHPFRVHDLFVIPSLLVLTFLGDRHPGRCSRTSRGRGDGVMTSNASSLLFAAHDSRGWRDVVRRGRGHEGNWTKWKGKGRAMVIKVEDEGLARGVTWRDILMGSIDGVTHCTGLNFDQSILLVRHSSAYSAFFFNKKRPEISYSAI
jgi:hypothetical protein